ncbi:hypothetical protein McaMca56_007179 [Microsporum canis]
MEPYSPLLGHLPLLKTLGKGLPRDAHGSYTSMKILQNWQKYFPTAKKCPPLVYLDAWPFMAQPIIMVIAPELCSQLTQETPQPRHSMFGWALTPVTDGIDLISMNMADHKVWRSRLNPGFSSRNVIQNMPAILEEVSIFAQKLKDTTDTDGYEWGNMFTLYDAAVALTFDVISRFTLDIHLNEQTSGPGPLLKSMRNLIALVKLKNIKNRLERLTPGFKRVVSQNAATIRNILLPQIELRFSEALDSKNQKTVIDLAIKQLKESGEQPTPELMNIIVANLKAFLFAGHDTTAQTICWVFYEINKYPDILQILRTEHDQVLGPDPKSAKRVLQESPHKLNELNYTAAVIKETLRMHSLANTLRQGSPNFNFSLDGMQYPTDDCFIQTVPTLTHIHPDLWPRPAEFIPDRFLVPEGHPLYPVKNAWRPFELGNTKCIGQELALSELKLALVFTVRELDFDFNYELWDRVQGRKTAETVNGERAYRCGSGIGEVKDDMPVDLFLAELERRLQWLEDYRQSHILQIDSGLRRAYGALIAVRDSCSHASGELMGGGRRRARIAVETLESRYNEALATKETLEQKAQASMRLMEDFLSQLEARVHSVRDRGLYSAIDEGLRAVDSSITHARVMFDEGIERAVHAKIALRESIDRAIALAKEKRLIHYSDLPHPWRVNPHIRKGYRFTASKIECLTSVFSFSNEMVNIWSHLIGLIIVLCVAFYFYPLSPNFSLSTKTDVTIAFIFFIAACKCLVCSTLWHTMNSIANQPLMERFACVDYTGISLLVAASIVTTEYTAFYCEPYSRWIYILMTSTLGIAGVILPWHPRFNGPHMAWARVAFYVTLALTGFAPIVQLSLTRGLEWSLYFYAPVVKSILVYFCGACIYASQIPERWHPGFFDYVGGSHNIWHVAVLGGILFHYLAMQDLFAGAFLRAKGECPCLTS